MSLVLDSSATLAWVYADDATGEFRYFRFGYRERGVGSLLFGNSRLPLFWRSASGAGSTMPLFATPPLLTWRCCPFASTQKPTTRHGARPCGLQISTSSQSTTQRIWNWRSEEDCRWRRWIRIWRGLPGSNAFRCWDKEWSRRNSALSHVLVEITKIDNLCHWRYGLGRSFHERFPYP